MTEFQSSSSDQYTRTHTCNLTLLNRSLCLFPLQFDKIWGWGHSFIEAGDFWEGIKVKYGRRWAWHAAHADQGLLYYFAKYAKKDVSIIIGDRIQSWSANDGTKQGNLRGSNDEPIRESDTPNTLLHYVQRPLLDKGARLCRRGVASKGRGGSI